MLYSSEFPKEVSAWPQVTTGPHRFGGSEFRFQRAEIGHLHSDGTLDIPFPLRVRDWLIAEGIVTPHHFLPKSGWTTFHVDETNAERALWLLRLSYLRYAVKQATKKRAGQNGDAERFVHELEQIAGSNLFTVSDTIAFPASGTRRLKPGTQSRKLLRPS
jgi:hypothetical protein